MNGWNRGLWIMRIACPILGAAAAIVGYLAWRNGSYVTMAINAILVGINIVLTLAQWFVFKPR